MSFKYNYTVCSLYAWLLSQAQCIWDSSWPGVCQSSLVSMAKYNSTLCTTVCSHLPRLRNIWVISRLWQLQIKLLKTFTHKNLYRTGNTSKFLEFKNAKTNAKTVLTRHLDTLQNTLLPPPKVIWFLCLFACVLAASPCLCKLQGEQASAHPTIHLLFTTLISSPQQ